jgi:hypothetical protein
MFMWCRRFLWPDITALCSGEDDEVTNHSLTRGKPWAHEGLG